MAARTIAIAGTPPEALVEINGPTPDKWWSVNANAAGYAPFHQIDDSFGDSAIRITATGYKPYLVGFRFHNSADPQHWGVPMNQQVNVGVQIPALQPDTLPRLWASDHGLVTDSGQPFIWAGADSFRLHERVVLGENVDLHLDQLQAAGVKVVRILNDAEWFRFKTWERPESYSLIPTTAAKLASRGMYGQWCVFADWQQVWGGDASRGARHLGQVIDAMAQCPNLIGQMVNEGNEHSQGFPFEWFGALAPDDILFSIGSNGTGDDPPFPKMARGHRDRYNSFGAERRTERYALNTTTIWYAINGWRGEQATLGYEGTQWTTVCDEPPNVGADYGYGPEVAYLLGVGCRFDEHGQAAGGNAHYTAGKQSLPASEYDLACVRAFIRGVTAV